MAQEFGGSPLADFPQPEKKDNEFEVSAKINASGTNFTEISARLMNKTAWPARMSEKLKVLYFVDLTEVFAAGYGIADITLSLNYNQDSSVKSATLRPADPTRNLYYVELDFAGAKIYPGGQSQFSKEVQFRLALPAEAKTGSWDPLNDFSFAGLAGSTEAKITDKLAAYENGVKVFGTEPSGILAIQNQGQGPEAFWTQQGQDIAFHWPQG
jgi:endoglucanase